MNAAAEQSLTPVIPSMSDPITIESLLSPTGVAFDSIVWGCMPGDEQFKPKSILSYGMSLDPSNIPKNALMLIGPEGDFSFAEKEMLVTKGAHAVFVSSNRLRTETAAIAMLSILAEALRLPNPHKPLQN
jgi:RsmE family RNA methyltransferase